MGTFTVLGVRKQGKKKLCRPRRVNSWTNWTRFMLRVANGARGNAPLSNSSIFVHPIS